MYNRNLAIEAGKFSMIELKFAIKQLKSGKAAGDDGISAEALKYLPECMLDKLLNICNEVYDGAPPPDDWKNGVIVPLPKKGNLSDCNNWRGITLLSIAGKAADI